MKIRFLLDENLSPNLKTIVSSRAKLIAIFEITLAS
ncbi:hypothetical protein MiTe_00692 [Microcystis aeruginosa NIES-2520]|jgi:hypothetical protein|uniref:Uncharacterized protein n=2 Tax=Microcystis aeruginosa TaxID=1126 RepID=A0A2Z6UQU0_MICAE|nr:hypothetical protein MSj_03045 [Microcystis aeruginosa Sj]GCA73872.1 hypothetical protein MiTe_00692 [Microcystis aeruginosa NIES-2520]